MLIEQSAYANRWRRTTPAAKALFSLGGFIAAFSAASPSASLSVAAVLAVVTLAGAGVPLGRYLRVLAPGLFFLAASCLSLAFTLGPDAESGALSVYLSDQGLQQVRTVGSRSLAALLALLFLVLSIVFSVTEPFFLFFNRNKDGGMPPRRPDPVCIPPEPDWCDNSQDTGNTDFL